MDVKPIIHGDLINSDTRNVLAISDIGEVDLVFKATNPVDSIGSALSRTQNDFAGGTSAMPDIDDVANSTVVIAEHQKKIMGSSAEIIRYSCMKDRRNKPIVESLAHLSLQLEHKHIFLREVKKQIIHSCN